MEQTLGIIVEYDGSEFGGWQRQTNADTVQERLEKALNRITGQTAAIVGAGRTDAGVHAAGQTAHAKLSRHVAIPEHKLPTALNTALPKSIRVKKATIFENGFHARFDAIAREYVYNIAIKPSVFNRAFAAHIKYPLDYDKLNLPADLFLGKRNFTTFSKHNPDTLHYNCNIDFCRWTFSGDIIRLKIRADRFVYGMVRSLAGVMIDCARGKRSVDEIAGALQAQNRKFISPLAPPNGLILNKIYYPAYINKQLGCY